MTTYTFNPTTTTQFLDWDSPNIWSPEVVPNSPDADVVFPVIYENIGVTTSPYTYFVTLNTGATYSIRSLLMNANYLLLDGTLNGSQSVTLNPTSEIDMGGGTLSAGSLTNDGLDIQGAGQVQVSDSLANQTEIIGSGLTISAGSFTNNGLLIAAEGDLTIVVPSGGFANFANGVLTGGTYTVGGTGLPPSHLSFNVGGTLTVDAASINLNFGGGEIEFFDPATQQYTPIQATLQTIAAGGTLTLGTGQIWSSGPLTVSGTVVLSGGASGFTSGTTLGPTGLIVADGGTVRGTGTISSAILNDGVIGAFAAEVSTNVAGDDLVISGNISGSGELAIQAGVSTTFSHGSTFQTAVGGTIELNGTTSQNVDFTGGAGTLQLDQPTNFTGSLFADQQILTTATFDVLLEGVSFDSVTGYSYSGDASHGTLTIDTSQRNYTLNFLGNYDTTDFSLSAGPQPLSTTPPSLSIIVEPQAICFCRGTRIVTERGEVPVEELAVGDRVVTMSGAAKPIVWIGYGRDLVTRRNSLARPIIVRAGAFADGVPKRDLFVTHGHAFHFNGVLVPIEHLVNHRSILWDERARAVEYYHIELEDHDVIFAEGAPAETYYDAGNRALFHNTDRRRPRRPAKPWAPVVHDGERLGEIWAALFARAGGMLEKATTDDPDLHLLADGMRLDPTAIWNNIHWFGIARPPAALSISSRSGVPSLLGLSRHDHRRLGIAIRRILLQHAGIATSLSHDAPQLQEGGCHSPEASHCWTDGEFTLPPRFFSQLNGGFELFIETVPHHDMRYPMRAAIQSAA